MVRNGKPVGETPLTLRSIADKDLKIELRLADYALTNFSVRVPENAMSSYAIRLFSKRYLETVQNTKRALEANELERASELVAVALGIEPNDPTALALSKQISDKLAAQEQQRLAAERLAAKAARDALAALALLEPEKIIKSCLAKSDSKFSKLNTVDAAQSNPVAVPVAAATDVIVKGIEVLTFPFQKSEKKPRFDQAQFVHDYGDRFYRYYGIIKSIDVTNNSVVFVPSGTSKQSCAVLACVGDVSALATLKSGSPIWVSGKLKTLDEMAAASPYANRLTLMGCTFYPPETLPNKK